MVDRDRSPLSRTLEAFANAVLDRTLPRLRQWLVARLGPVADLKALELDGPRVHLVDAVIPLGAHALLRVEHATLLTRADQLVVGLPPVELQHLVGRVELVRGGPTLAVTLERASATRASEAWVAGWLRLSAADVGGTAWRGSAYVRLTSERLLVEVAKLDEVDGEGRLELSLAGTLGGSGMTLTEASGRLHAAPAAAALELRRLFGAPSVELARPVRISGEGRLSRVGALSGELRAEDTEAWLSIEGRAGADGRLDARGQGVLDPSIVRPHPALALGGGSLAVGLRLVGTRRRPRVELELGTDRLQLAWQGGALALSRARLRCTMEDGLALDARARVGEHGRLTLRKGTEGPLRVRAERFPLTPLRPWLDRAPMAIDQGCLWAELALHEEHVEGSAHLESPHLQLALKPLRLARADLSLDGTRVRAEVQAQPLMARARGVLSVELAVGRAPLSRPNEWLAEGELRAPRVELRLPRADVSVQELHADLRIEGGALSLREARARVLGGSIEGSAAVRALARPPRLEVRALQARGLSEMPTLLRRWTRLADPPLEGLVIDADLVRVDGERLGGTLSARTARSSFEAQVQLCGGSLDGTTVEGSLSVADLAPLVEGWALRPDLEGRWKLEGSVCGDLLEPALRLRVDSGHQRLWVRSHHGAVPLDAHGWTGLVEASRERIAWSALRAEGYGGWARSEGCFALGLGALFARIEGEGVAVEALPLPRGRSLGEHLEGVLSGALDVLAGPRTYVARGRACVDAPRWHGSRRAWRVGSWVDLRAPSAHGVAPFEAALRIDEVGWTVSELVVPLGDLSARGALELRHDGRLRGLVHVRPSPGWLRESPMLASVADALGPLPVRLAGSLDAPEVRLLELGTLEPAATSSCPSARATGALLDALARELDPEIFEHLLERGLHPAEIGAQLVHRRR